MKNFKFLLFSILLALVVTACTPQEFDDYQLGASYTIAQDQFAFDITPGSDTWTYNFTASFSADAVKYPYSYEIRFGDGNVTKDLSGTHEYVVFAGTYTAQCIVYNPNGDVLIKEKTFTFTEDNPKAHQDDKTSVQYALTGGKDNLNGKIWLMKEGAAGLGPATQTWPEWWQIDATALFDDVFTFKPNVTEANGAFVYDNHGDTFVNESLAGLFADGDPAGSFTTFLYTPATDASWEVTVRDGKNYLVLNKAFLGYPVTANDLTKTEYEITAFSPDEVSFKYYSPDGNAWFFTLQQPIVDEPNPLTGTGTKVWVIDANNKHVDEVKNATGKNIKGFMGLGPADSYGQEWWGAVAGEKENWTLFGWKFTFDKSKKLTISDTGGEGYGRKACIADAGFTATSVDGDDATFPYEGGNYTYSVTDGPLYPTLTLSGNAFMGYYAGSQDYDIVYLSDTALALRVYNATEDQDWVFVFCPEGEQ